ncbi:hypothetical protein HanPI659440_Chr10g0397861 [Helianthus annuus]|nr:hypothetical protein HanPI659440_Chr10g0397861 [Helianthus annuus]
MYLNSTNEYYRLVRGLGSYSVPKNVTDSFLGYESSIARSELQNHFSAPMFWIGMYIALASLVCILAMVADLLHGFRSRKLWFPCKYFRINAAFLTIISVAMKLPVDLTGSMMGDVDKAAKLGSMAFMCTMMANLLPCLATMDNNELLSNITALSVLVITLVVNVCIQIQTGVLSIYHVNNYGYLGLPFIVKDKIIDIIASIYVIFLVVLLMIHVCSSVAILKSKKIIESKYQKRHDRASKDIQPTSGEVLTPEKLKKHVSNHWIMAGSGSPQFIIACFQTTSATGVICLLVTMLHSFIMNRYKYAIRYKDYDSDYGWTMMVIIIVQSIGIVIGTIAPLSRCFSTLSFKVSSKVISKQFKVFKVESYWNQKLYDWKHASIRLPFRSRSLEVVMETLKRLFINIFIGFQNGVVVVCKVIALIPFLFMISFLYCFRGIKWLLKAVLGSWGKKFEKLEENNDLRPYILQLEDEIELGEKTLKRLSKSVNRFIKKGAKSQPNNLMKLVLEKSTSGFQGVKNFDHYDDQDVQFVDCWRLPVVSLTTIAVSFPKIEKKEVDNLLESVREGLVYVTVVEKSFNGTDDHVNFQRAAETLWQEIIFNKNWLGNDLQDRAFQVNTDDHLIRRSICASSMYRITETILLTFRTNIDVTVSQKKLFDDLSSMIADIIAACLTNLPQAIMMKCHNSVIKKREDSVKDAAQLLGETTEIIKTLQDRDIPDMNPSDFPFIEKWRAYLGNP